MPEPRVRGALLQARFQWLRRRHGAEAVGRLLDELPEADRARLQGLEAGAWYPLGCLLGVDATLERLYADGDPGFLEELGADSARVRLVWLREHAPLVSVHALLARAAEEHGELFDFGQASYQRTGFTHGELAYSGCPRPSAALCRAQGGYLAEVVRLQWSLAPAVEETECQAAGGARCVFRVRWSPAGPESSRG